MPTVTFTSSGTWTAPAGVTQVDCQCWGPGGAGAQALSGSHSGGGGGGGEYAEEPTLAVTPSSNYNYTISAGNSTTFPGDSKTVTAHAGAAGSSNNGGSPGVGSTNTVHANGGSGGNGQIAANRGGGGGGGAGGTNGAGGAGGANSIGTGGSGGTAGTGGGNGGAGGSNNSNGNNGNTPGGGGGGGGDTGTSHIGGTGAGGQITLTYTASVQGTATLAGVGTLTAQGTAATPGSVPATQVAPGQAWLRRFGYGRRMVLPGRQVQTLSGTATLAGVGTMAAFGGVPNPAAVNQWSNSYGQSAVLGPVPPALQSCVTPLTPAFSVGPGSGTPTAGNWLFTIVSWTQVPANGTAHIGVGDDIHSYWREFPASSINGITRTSISYTPNIARTVGNVYVAPDDQITAINVLVVEIAGLGPWDSVVGTNSNYAAAATSLSLSQAAGAQATFFIGAVGGDNVSASQAFLPSGWTGLATQTQTNGMDHTADNILTAAFLPATLATQNVSGTTSPAENLSGFILAVIGTATSPVPAGHNPNWPYFIFEAAFGGGFNTPNSELTWTDISNRLWSFDETTGVQYQLGALQSTNLDLELDNFDGALSSLNTASPYYPNVTSGTPLRVRAAISTIAGVTANRWYVIQRNAQQWPEEIDDAYRRFAPATGTDTWAILSATGPTPYRGEVYADDPYAWWTCDDQPGPGGVLPTTLLNSAVGNSNLLNILLSPFGALVNQANATNGHGLAPSDIQPLAGSANYTVGADSGWMYGDPQSTPASALAGNEITASPGSAAWQATSQYGTSGSDGWFLSCNDAGFPALNGGITIEGWFNYSYFGTSSGYLWVLGGGSSFGFADNAGQPVTSLTLIEIATNSNPVAVLQMNSSGHLNLITYNGSTGTSHAIYSGSDLRSSSWFSVTMTLTTTAWTVWLDGGDLAKVSGTATGMTSAWDWFIVNADMGSGGGGTTSGIAHGGNVSVAHLAVYPEILPAYRIQAHYWAAVTGFGLLPAPQTVALAQIGNSVVGSTADAAVTYSADGSVYGNSTSQGYGGHGTGNFFATPDSLAALVVANAGAYTSAPSAWGQVILYGINTGSPPSSQETFGVNAFVTWTGLATTFEVFTSTQVAAGASAGITRADSIAFISGYGASANVTGLGLISGGDGSSPPSMGSVIGDNVAQRIERVIGYANATSTTHYPGRCIDAASLLVQAALDIGGQQAGQSVQNLASSDGGMLFIDNPGRLVYWQKSHLASQYSSPVWNLGPSAGRIPYAREIRWISDPQRVLNAIEIQPYSPSGAALPIITPANGTGVSASQLQYGAQPYQISSYLQSTAEMQSQANWVFSNFGTPPRRAENVKIDAATYPQAWTLVLGVNVSDVVTIEDWQIGGGGNVYTYRVTNIKRKFSFGDDRQVTEASVTLQLDPEPTSYWA